jgi:channel protein (hemolysin III family)
MAGIYFFIKETPLSHAIWHVFVMAGSACHYSAIAGSLRLA